MNCITRNQIPNQMSLPLPLDKMAASTRTTLSERKILTYKLVKLRDNQF